MAFNPFHRFRKHQKVIFAALTIISMLSFIGIAGVSAGGDLFSELSRWIVGGARSSTEVALLYGKRVGANEILYLREQRRIANQFMALAIPTAHSRIMEPIQRSLQATPPRYDERQKAELQQIMQGWQFAFQVPQYFGQQFYKNLSQYLRSLELMQRELDQAKKPAEKQEIQKLYEALRQESWLFQDGQGNTPPKDPLYPDYNLWFGGGLSTRALLDFMVWRRQADRLGIELTADDVRHAIQRETLGRLTQDDVQAIERRLGLDRNRGLDLLAALTDEFRVRLAQATLVGYDPAGFPQTPAPITPHELWEYYRRTRTEVNVKLLPVPAAEFLAQVKQAPSEEELRALFERYQDVEPSPTRDEPGFKQPRRVKVEWVEARADSKTYRRAAEAAARVLQTTLPLAWAGQLLQEYDNEKFSLRLPSWTDANFVPSFYSLAALHRPEDIASLIGQSLAVAGPQGSPLAAAAGSYGTAVAHNRSNEMAAALAAEARTRVSFAMALFGAASAAPVVPTGLSPLTAVAATWEHAAGTDHYLPLSIVKGQLVRRVEDSLARKFVENTLAAFKKDLEARRGKQEPFIGEEVRKYNWAHGSSRGLDDANDIARDPGLKPLRDAYVAMRPADPKAKQFATQLFQPGETRKLYAPEQLIGSDGTFLYWKTADETARVLTFEEARPQVVAAWRLGKARELAKAKADAIAKDANKPGADPVPGLTEAAKRLGQNLFELDGIALLKGAPTSRAGFSTQYESYRFPEDKIEYPGPDFAKDLLELKQPGDVKVVADEPRTTYYVAALTQRLEPSVGEFQKDTAPRLFEPESYFLSRLENERRTEYRSTILARLREEAKLVLYEDAARKVEERERGSLSED